MSDLPSTLERFRPHSVPVCVFAVVAAAAVLVPPLVLGLSARTYAIAAAVLILGVTSAAPYAVAVSVVTLPLLYAGAGSYASPAAVLDAERPAPVDALRHVAAGIVYVLAAGAVGAIGVGASFAADSGSSTLPTALRPVLMVAGSALVAATFVGLQLWRHDGPAGDLETRTLLGTIVLGLFLLPAGPVALLLFGGI